MMTRKSPRKPKPIERSPPSPPSNRKRRNSTSTGENSPVNGSPSRKKPRLSFRKIVGTALNKEDVLKLIFQHSSVPDLRRCRLVSKRWNEVSTPILRQRSLVTVTVDQSCFMEYASTRYFFPCVQVHRKPFTSSHKSLASFLEYINRSSYKLDEAPHEKFSLVDIAIPNLTSDVGLMFRNFFQKFGPNIKFLRIKDCDFLDESVVQEVLGQFSPRLEALELDSKSIRLHSPSLFLGQAVGVQEQLREVKLGLYIEAWRETISWKGFFEWAPNIEILELKVYDWTGDDENSSCTGLLCLLQDLKTLRAQGSLNNLKHLFLNLATRMPIHTSKFLQSLLQSLSETRLSLHSFKISVGDVNFPGQAVPEMPLLRVIKSLGPSLVRLDLRNLVGDHSNKRMKWFAFPFGVKMAELQELYISHHLCPHLNFPSFCPKLKVLSICGKSCCCDLIQLNEQTFPDFSKGMGRPFESLYPSVRQFTCLSSTDGFNVKSFFYNFSDSDNDSCNGNGNGNGVAGENGTPKMTEEQFFQEINYDPDLRPLGSKAATVPSVGSSAKTVIAVLRQHPVDNPLKSAITENTLSLNKRPSHFLNLTTFRFTYWLSSKQLEALAGWLPSVERLSMPLTNESFRVVTECWRGLKELVVLGQCVGSLCLDDDGIAGVSKLLGLRVFKVDPTECGGSGKVLTFFRRGMGHLPPVLSKRPFVLSRDSAIRTFLNLKSLTYLEIFVAKDITVALSKDLLTKVPLCVLHYGQRTDELWRAEQDGDLDMGHLTPRKFVGGVKPYEAAVETRMNFQLDCCKFDSKRGDPDPTRRNRSSWRIQ